MGWRGTLSLFGLVVLPCQEMSAQWTEVPTTAPVGRLLLEVDVLTAATDRYTSYRDGVTYRALNVGSVFASSGLTEHCDVQLGVELWHEYSATGSGTDWSGRGMGDVWLRAKWNFRGDEASESAWALLSYVKLGTGSSEVSNGVTEPGLLLVYGSPLGDSMTWNANVGLDWLNDAAGGRDLYVTSSAVVTRTLSERWSAYAEFYGYAPTNAWRDWSGELGCGVTCAMGESGWIDIACYVGLTRAASDYTPALRCGWQF